MKLIAPNYYKEFHCIADKCKHSCCKAGWEIDIDDKTANFYNSVESDFGNKLKTNIKNNSENTSKCFSMDSNGVCPFLNSSNLCDIYINLGEEHLCDICKEHPRYYEWFDNCKEVGIGLCCEEAARIILSCNEKFDTYEIEIPYEDSFSYDSNLYNYLLSARNQVINYINNTQDIHKCVDNLLWFAQTLQQNIDFDLLDEEEIFDVPPINTEIKNYLEFLLTLEPNDSTWPIYIKNCINLYSSNQIRIPEFLEQHSEVNTYLKNISLYFVWRYFMKSVFDEDVYSKINFMAISTKIINALFFCKWIKTGNLTLEDCIDIVRRYSEEIEYCEENIEKLSEFFGTRH